MNTLTPEESLLISLCRLKFTEEQISEISYFMTSISDWDLFVKMANYHGIIALCWNNICETENSPLIPPEHLTKLHNLFHLSFARNTLIYNHLEFLLSFLQKESFKIVLLKGLALEKMVYGDKGLRQMNDLDILVRKSDAILIRNILIRNGFESVPLVSRFYEKILPPFGKHLPEMYFKGLILEIHIKLFDDLNNLLTAEFIEKSVTGRQKNYEIFLPDPQLLFLYLINHLADHEAHNTSQLRLYTDLIILISAFYGEVINQKLFDYAISAGIEKELIAKLAILQQFWDVKYPEWINSKIDNANKELILERFIQFLRHPENKPLKDKQKSIFKMLKDVPGFINRFLLVVSYFFPSLTFMKFKYKTKSTIKTVFLYPIRWISIMAKEIGRSSWMPGKLKKTMGKL